MFTRIGRFFKAIFNAVLGEAEAQMPVSMLEQSVREMLDNLRVLREATATTIAFETRAKRDLDAQNGRVKGLDRQAEDYTSALERPIAGLRIGLPKEFIDDTRDPQATIAAVRAIIASETAAHWQPLFAKADCCVTIVASIEEALHDPHFVARGLFDRKVSAPDGRTMPALPVPISPAFRGEEKTREYLQHAGFRSIETHQLAHDMQNNWHVVRK